MASNGSDNSGTSEPNEQAIRASDGADPERTPNGENSQPTPPLPMGLNLVRDIHPPYGAFVGVPDGVVTNWQAYAAGGHLQQQEPLQEAPGMVNNDDEVDIDLAEEELPPVDDHKDMSDEDEGRGGSPELDDSDDFDEEYDIQSDESESDEEWDEAEMNQDMEVQNPDAQNVNAPDNENVNEGNGSNLVPIDPISGLRVRPPRPSQYRHIGRPLGNNRFQRDGYEVQLALDVHPSSVLVPDATRGSHEYEFQSRRLRRYHRDLARDTEPLESEEYLARLERENEQLKREAAAELMKIAHLRYLSRRDEDEDGPTV